MSDPDPIAVAEATIDRECRRCRLTFTARTVFAGDRTIATSWYCDSCEATIRLAAAEARAELKDALEIQRITAALRHLNAPPLFDQVRISALEPHGSEDQQRKLMRATTLARRIAGEITGGLTTVPFVAFLGGPGTGKTMLAWAIGTELALCGVKARVVRLSALVRDLRAAWKDRDGPDEDTRLRAYIDVPFLAIDEVSRHAFYGQQIHQHLYDVINARLEYERPTVITSNETQEGLAEILGPALMDRLATGGPVPFGDESYRRRPKAA